MKGIFSSSNQNQSKTLEEVIRKNLDKAIEAYVSYLYTKGRTLRRILKYKPQAFRSLSELIKNLENFGECKSFLTNDQEALQKCIDEYNFRRYVLEVIWKYTTWKHTPEEIKEFTKGLEALAKEGKQVIEDLYKRYQQYKITSIPREDLDPRVLEIIPENWAIKSLIIRYLENPEGYGKQLSKYLRKKLLEARVEEREEVKAEKELRKAIINHTLYVSNIKEAYEIISKHIPKALPSLAKLIENLRDWDKSDLLTNNQEALKEYADKCYFKAYFMKSILEWQISKLNIQPKEIERFIKNMRTLAEEGKEIIDGLYRHYKEVERTTLERILKDKNYQTILPYKLKEARASAARSIMYLLVNYFKNPEEHKYQLMKYIEKPLRR